MNTKTDLPILIVGAGPTGLTAALELSRRGVPVRLIERRDGPSPLSRAVGLMPGSMDIFKENGVEDAIRAEAIEVEAIEIWRGDKQVSSLQMNTHEDPSVRLLCLPQDRTEGILTDEVAKLGVTTEYETEFESLSQDGDKITATVNGETREYTTILGCDGSRSPVREAIGLKAEGYDLDEEWSIADIDIPSWTDSKFRVSIMDSGELAFLIPMAKSRYRLVTTEPVALEANQIKIPEYSVRRAGAFRIGVRQVPTYNVGNIWLAGDAAHTHSPVGGRGMNLGIADASEWARRHVDGTLDGYSESRHAIGEETIKFTENNRKMLQDGSDFKRDTVVFASRLLNVLKPFHASIAYKMVRGEF